VHRKLRNSNRRLKPAADHSRQAQQFAPDRDSPCKHRIRRFFHGASLDVAQPDGLHARRANTKEKNRRAEAPFGDTESKTKVDALAAAAGLALPQQPADRAASASPSGAALPQHPEDWPAAESS
jgi:hypothetical protein